LDSSGRQRKSRAKTGDDFTATKKKKKVRAAPSSAKTANKTEAQASSSSNAKKSDKKKVVNGGREAATANSVAVPANVDSRSGRSSSRSALDRVEDRSVAVDYSSDDDDSGEWITKVPNV